jgi:hypothetical protein
MPAQVPLTLLQIRVPQGARERARDFFRTAEEEGEEMIRLPWRGQCGRAAAGCARATAALRC